MWCVLWWIETDAWKWWIARKLDTKTNGGVGRTSFTALPLCLCCFKPALLLLLVLLLCFSALPSQCSALTSSRHSASVWRELECDAKRNIGIQWRETVHSLSVVVWTKCIKYKGRMRGRRGCYCCLLLCWSLLFLAAFLPFSPVSCSSQQRISRYVRKSQQPD